jgi:hypothetical protein
VKLKIGCTIGYVGTCDRRRTFAGSPSANRPVSSPQFGMIWLVEIRTLDTTPIWRLELSIGYQRCFGVRMGVRLVVPLGRMSCILGAWAAWHGDISMGHDHAEEDLHRCRIPCST